MYRYSRNGLPFPGGGGGGGGDTQNPTNGPMTLRSRKCKHQLVITVAAHIKAKNRITRIQNPIHVHTLYMYVSQENLLQPELNCL